MAISAVNSPTTLAEIVFLYSMILCSVLLVWPYNYYCFSSVFLSEWRDINCLTSKKYSDSDTHGDGLCRIVKIWVYRSCLTSVKLASIIYSLAIAYSFIPFSATLVGEQTYDDFFSVKLVLPSVLIMCVDFPNNCRGADQSYHVSFHRLQTRHWLLEW